MECFKTENLGFLYNDGRSALSDINISINKGEFVVLCGRSGSGKSTFLRCLKPALTVGGMTSGKILFDGQDIISLSLREQSEKIGFVSQNPDSMIVTDKVWHELAFGLESLGYTSDEIRMRVAETASFFGLESLFYRNISELSGGQKQLLNLASACVLRPEALILDEPMSQLDPIASADFLNLLCKINEELGTTVIIAVHSAEDVLCRATRLLYMENGRITVNAEPQKLNGNFEKLYGILPASAKIALGIGMTQNLPLTVKDGQNLLTEYEKTHTIDIVEERKVDLSKEIAVNVKSVWFKYEKNSHDILKNFSLCVKKGEIFCVLGGNGSGKSTALSVITGINKPYRGKTEISEKISAVPQDPKCLFIKDTVLGNLKEITSDTEKIRRTAEICGVSSLFEVHPYDISGGEQQRLAIAMALLTNPGILVLDEPTKGLDYEFKETFSTILADLKSQGTTVIIVSHDTEFCAENADRCALLFDGGIVSADYPQKFFSDKSFYTTPACRIANEKIKNAVTVGDIITACGGKITHEPPRNYKKKEMPIQPTKTVKPPKKADKHSALSYIILAFAVPLTIFCGIYFWQDRRWYTVSLIIVLEALAAFVIGFEKNRPKAKELVLLSVLCALGVGGRLAFFAFPQVKPVMAVVIMSGVCFGAETGFAAGALTAFVSNMFFGQGVWTPWQMFSFGIIGFISGILYNTGILRKRKLSICIFGAIATIAIYGGIMNPASVLMMQSNPTAKMLIASYASGISMDIIHASSTVIFLWLISDEMIKKSERLKKKYNII